MASNVVTLKLQGTSDLTSISTGLKGIATESKNAGAPLNTLNQNLTKTGQTTATLGQKLKGFGSNFGGLITNVAGLGGSLLNLTRQYQDLGDTQIAVEKAQRKVSTAHEAVEKAQTALNKATEEYGAGSEKAKQATLDLDQAQSQLSINTQLLTERQEDHQRAQENFWIGLVPTITTAGGTIMQTLQSIGGTKGIGGLKTAIQGISGLGGKTGLFSGLATALTGIGTAAAGSVGGMDAMTGAMGRMRLALAGLSTSIVPIAIGIGGIALLLKPAAETIHMVIGAIRGDMFSMVDSLENLLDMIGNLPLMGGPLDALKKLGAFGPLQEGIKKLKEEMIAAGDGGKQFNDSLTGIDTAVGQVAKGMDFILGPFSQLTQEAQAAGPALDTTATGLDGIGTSAPNAAAGLDQAGQSINNFATMTTTGLALVVEGVNNVTNAMLSADTDPYNTGLLGTADAASFATNEIAILTAASLDGANAARIHTDEEQQRARALQNMSKNANQATQSIKKLVTMTNKIPYSSSLSGPRNPNFRIRSDYQPPIVGGKPSTRIKFKTAQTGMNELLSQDTMIMAHKGEHARISPKGKGGGDVYVGPIYLDGEQIYGRMRYKIIENQGIFK